MPAAACIAHTATSRRSERSGWRSQRRWERMPPIAAPARASMVPDESGRGPTTTVRARLSSQPAASSAPAARPSRTRRAASVDSGIVRDASAPGRTSFTPGVVGRSGRSLSARALGEGGVPGSATPGRGAAAAGVSGLCGEGLPDGLRQHEAHILGDHLELGDVLDAELAEEFHEALDQLLRRARARGDPDHLLAVEPGLVDLAGVVDKVGLGAVVAGDLDEALRVRRVARADDQHEVALL